MHTLAARERPAQEATPVAPTPAVSNNTANGTTEPPVTSITMQTPDNVIGETLVVQGRVEFQNLLRIDGHFEVSLHGTKYM